MNVAKECGLYEIINKCVNGLETQMTKEFDDNGVILSGENSKKSHWREHYTVIRNY